MGDREEGVWVGEEEADKLFNGAKSRSTTRQAGCIPGCRLNWDGDTSITKMDRRRRRHRCVYI